jgi:hypothetical protein
MVVFLENHTSLLSCCNNFIERKTKMLAWIVANYLNVAVGIISVAEVVSFFVPKSAGTLKGLISALVALGAKDPQVLGQ